MVTSVTLRVMGTIHEWFGFQPTDTSHAAAAAANSKLCPFLAGPCTKSGGVCSVVPSASVGPVIVCPKRLYFHGHEFLRVIAHTAFYDLDLDLDVDGLPTLVPGAEARSVAARKGLYQAAVFGQGFGGEIKLPPAVPGGGQYSVDFTIVVVSPDGELKAFVPVEVQSIDTTGSYRESLSKLEADRSVVSSKFNMNWENVNKRILPQLIVKGLMLQAERLCSTGLYFVTPEPVYERIMARLGGLERLRRIPPQPGSITFMRYNHDERSASEGSPLELDLIEFRTASTSDLSLAFITPENLPAGGSYEMSIMQKL